ncbi:relaxase domain-containing protein (plasmid) [Mycobacterium intracellulare subsp. chimaera]|uniref:MobF family relaxase n=2 Tax=Mycobacterium intracellulare TaxID=1767 RepID=UPI000449F74D|nr:MobF family relaxase [Mycobacterium intracellulare]ASL24334.1 ATP-dependent exoDNAse [Mycobacterium intracellulare subsp. chimaera]ETZ36174.1 AAA domain protein [Mycobacterium intracellulare MIN_052511_1280]KPN47517.1 AAA family ATPase [Mycobacterium intracellulare subsp. chimaera]MCV7323531.1 relaxase domain-containing protein [Mycobacterium intracellulare subsp. chimaera]MDM3935751.1 MobF family relaxase [Mycobacterium intracellulare subsp. chimaera]
MLTIAKLSRWSVNYYNDTARAAGQAAKDAQRAGGGLGEYYGEHDTRTPTWLCAGDARAAAELVGLSDTERAGGDADPEVVARWLDEGAAPNGVCGRGFGKRSVHGFDLTFCAPKSVSLIRALRGDDVADKAVLSAHTTAIAEALEYLAAHAGYSRVHNSVTGDKDLVRLPGLVAVAYQHETSRAGDPHLHTHVLVPNRQARGDGRLVSVDGTSLYHEAKAAGVIYQATLRRELHRSLGLEWAPVDPQTGMAEIAGIDPKTITAWSQRSSALREWAADNLTVVDAAKGLSAAQLGAAQKATRPSKPEQLAWAQLAQDWRADARGLRFDRDAYTQARKARQAWSAAATAPLDRRRLLAAAEAMDKATFTRADLVEVIGAQLPVDTERGPREMVEAAVDALGLRVTAPRLAHQREGHDRFTLEAFLAEEQGVLDLVDARDVRAQIWVNEHDAAGLSPDQKRAVHSIAGSPWLVCPLSAPAGAGKTTSLRALAAGARRFRGQVMVVAPTGKAVDVAIREGAGDVGYTVAKALKSLRDGTLTLRRPGVVIVDEAAMIGTDDLRQLLAATTKAGIKAVLVGDAHQLSPVKARGGMFAQLCQDLPWTQTLSEVWRMRDPEERSASLALRDGGPAPIRRAVDWYRANGRLHTGDDIAMAADALTGYQADTAAGKDTLLICDTTEMCDALNRRIHDDTIDSALPTVGAARGHRIAKGDVILSRRNDPTNPVHDAADFAKAADPVRNGQRWRVYAVDSDHDRIAARRLSDGARVAFTGDYLQEHVTHGYAVTVHSAQGVTADTTHAVLGEHTSRNLLYVALTRGRESNEAYLYERRAGETEHEHAAQLEPGVHLARRGTSRQAAHLARHIIGTRHDQAHTAHDVAAGAEGREQLPQRVQHLLDRRAHAVQRRRAAYWQSIQATVDERIEQQRFIDEHLSRNQDREQGQDYGLEL